MHPPPIELAVHPLPMFGQRLRQTDTDRAQFAE